MAKLSSKIYPVHFAENERELRETWGLSVSEMAEIAGVSASAVTAWEDRKILPPLDIMGRIGSYFDIHPAVLVWGDTVLTDSTPTIRMGMLSESDYKDLLKMRDKECGTLVLTENEMDLVRTYRELELSGRHMLRRTLKDRREQEKRIRELL